MESHLQNVVAEVLHHPVDFQHLGSSGCVSRAFHLHRGRHLDSLTWLAPRRAVPQRYAYPGRTTSAGSQRGVVQVVVARVMGERPLCGRNNVKHSMKQQKDVHMHVMVHVFQFVP